MAKRFTCEGCRRQRGRKRLVTLVLGMGVNELPPVQMRVMHFCGDCIGHAPFHVEVAAMEITAMFRKEAAVGGPAGRARLRVAEGS